MNSMEFHKNRYSTSLNTEKLNFATQVLSERMTEAKKTFSSIKSFLNNHLL